jgi:gamma-glutamylputrescine oxidase
MPFSYWEQKTFIKSPDVIIIGSGIVGLNAAIALKKNSTSLHVLVLERGMLPYGASTRNAGFACFGSISELSADLETTGEEKVFELVERRWKGLRLLRERLGDENIMYEPLGGFEIFTPGDQQVFEKSAATIHTFNKYLYSITGNKNNYRLADDKIESFGFRNVNHIIENTGEGQVDTGMMMKSLLQLAREQGVEVLNGANVSKIYEENNQAIVELSGIDHGSNQKIISGRVLVCVNGFAKKFFPELDVVPARAQVLVTSPINRLKVKGSFHYDGGYYYFRNVGDRLLFGGGRNLDFSGETTMDMQITPFIQTRLDELLANMILPDLAFEVEMRWSGIMGLGMEKQPVIRRMSENIFCAVRMGGMGVAIGTLVGNEAAEMVIKS